MRYHRLLPAILAISSPAFAEDALPEHTDIPDGFSTVICPDSATASTMLKEYHIAPANPEHSGIDTAMFFKGLAATGCKQKGDGVGVITIDAVRQRKQLTNGGGQTLLQYLGHDNAGNAIEGIVDEGWNNRFPRTELAEWLESRTSNGWLESGGGLNTLFRCPDLEGARKVVGELKALSDDEKDQFDTKFQDGLKAAGCRPAQSSYFVTARFEEAGHDCGFECYVELNALEAIDRSGLPAALIFDASLI